MTDKRWPIEDEIRQAFEQMMFIDGNVVQLKDNVFRAIAALKEIAELANAYDIGPAHEYGASHQGIQHCRCPYVMNAIARRALRMED